MLSHIPLWAPRVAQDGFLSIRALALPEPDRPDHPGLLRRQSRQQALHLFRAGPGEVAQLRGVSRHVEQQEAVGAVVGRIRQRVVLRLEGTDLRLKASCGGKTSADTHKRVLLVLSLQRHPVLPVPVRRRQPADELHVAVPFSRAEEKSHISIK